MATSDNIVDENNAEESMPKKKLTKAEKSWILYDVANSAFILLATSLLPIYFYELAQADGLDETRYMAIWALAAAVVTILMVVIGPFLGSLSDRNGWRKPIFVAIVLTGSLSCIVMGIPTWWVAFILIFVIAKIAFNASLVVSDGMLNDITTYQRMDTVSSRGYAMGYIGSCIPFIACLGVIVMSDFMDDTSKLTFENAILISLVITGIWWLVMSLPLFRSYEQKYHNDDEKVNIIGKIAIFKETILEIKSNPVLLLFLVAFFFYIDGVNTIIELSVAYGKTLGLDSLMLLAALLVSQVVAFPSTLIMNKISYKYGTHVAICICIVGYLCISAYAFVLSKEIEFFIMACCVGLFQGAIQALSRSYFGRMIPKDKTGEYFGVMDIFGKGATIIGTLSTAIVVEMFGAPKFLCVVLLVMFGIGLLFFLKSISIQVYDVEPT